MTRFALALGADILPTRRLSALPATAQTVFDRVRKADLAIGNFEMPLTERGHPVQKLLNIRAHPDIAADVPALGFHALTLANNHAVDYGWTGLADTAQALSGQGLSVIGLGENRAEAARVDFHQRAGLRIGVIAFSCLTPTGLSASEQRPGISGLHVETAYEIDPWYQMEEPGDPSVVKIRTRVRDTDRDFACERLRAARPSCDLLIVTIHWGYGSGELLAEYQRPLAEALIDAGADVIHGHHPHAVHPVGFYRGKPIFYGLGTLIGQQVFLPAPPAVQALWAGMSPDGVLAELVFADGELAELALLPTTLDADRLPTMAQGAAFERTAKRLQRLSAPYGANVAIRDEGLAITPLADAPGSIS